MRVALIVVVVIIIITDAEPFIVGVVTVVWHTCIMNPIHWLLTVATAISCCSAVRIHGSLYDHLLRVKTVTLQLI
uniref:Secreted protein n=1 Tax=Anopheles darlingi TaxID=43151 RepID=A0A2M4DA15_ANODA